MKLNEPLARELDRAAPAGSRQRSSFVRAALRQAIDEWADRRMTDAYKAQPDTDLAHFDPRLW